MSREQEIEIERLRAQQVHIHREYTKQLSETDAVLAATEAERDALRAAIQAATETKFYGYETRDIGRAYVADSVDDLLDVDVLSALIEQVRLDQQHSDYWRARWTPLQGDEIAAWLSSLIDFGWTRGGSR
jgi:hypothetical protein